MVKFDPNNSSFQDLQKQIIPSNENEKILVNKKNNEITKINLNQGIRWLNRAIVWAKVEIFKTDLPIEKAFQDHIKGEYNSLISKEAKFQKSKFNSHSFQTSNQIGGIEKTPADRLQKLMERVEKLSNLIDEEAKILPHTHLKDEYGGNLQALKTKLEGEAFVNKWSADVKASQRQSLTLPQKEEFFKRGFDFLKDNSAKIKELIPTSASSSADIAKNLENPFVVSFSKELDSFLNNYQAYIENRFKAFDESLGKADGPEAFKAIAQELSDFHASILTNKIDVENLFGMTQTGDLRTSLLAIEESAMLENEATGEIFKNAYKGAINTIEKHFADKVEELSSERSEAQKAFLQHEIASLKKSLPFDGAIKNLTEEIQSYQLSVNTLRKEIESLSGQEREFSEAVANNESFTGAAENYLRSAANSIVSDETAVPVEEQLGKVQEELALKTRNLNVLSDEIVQFESDLETMKKDRAQALSELPEPPQSAPEGTIKQIDAIKRELAPLLELPILVKNAKLTEQLVTLDRINNSMVNEKRAFEDLRAINSSWLILSENPEQLKAKEQNQYIADGCRALQKLASMSPEGRILTKENVDAIKFFKDSHEMLLSRSKEIDSRIRESLSQTPPDMKAVIESLKEYGDLKSAHANIGSIFSGKNMGNLYGYNFNQSPERIAAAIQNDKMQTKFAKLQTWVFEQSGIEAQEKENEFQYNIAKLDFQMQKIAENLQSHSEKLGSVKQKKVQLESDLNAMQNLETFLKRSELKTSAEAVTEKDLRTVLVAPLIEVYRKEQAIYRNTEMPLPEDEKQSVVIKDMNKRINALNREIKAAVEARDRYNVEVGGTVKSQKDAMERSRADLEADIKNLEAIVDKEADLNAVQAELKNILDIR